MTAVAEARSWRGFDALGFVGGGLRLCTVPALGARIVSLRGPDGHEWLVQPGRDPEPGDAAGEFVARDVHGWDEMVPTIEACRVGDAELPDHGEAWRGPWREEDGWLVFDGERLSYRLRRRIVTTSAGLELEYELESRSGAVPVLWAAHPVLAAPCGATVVLPAGVERLLDVTGERPRPERWSMGLARGERIERGAFRKLYVDPNEDVAWVALRRPGGEWLRLGWSGEGPAQLGLYFDNCASVGEPAVVLEPATGFYDALDRCVAAGRILVVEPGRPAAWRLTLEAGIEELS